MPKMLNPDSAAGNKRLKVAAKKKAAALKGKKNLGEKFIPDWSKPKGNRRRLLDATNKMNKEAGY